MNLSGSSQTAAFQYLTPFGSGDVDHSYELPTDALNGVRSISNSGKGIVEVSIESLLSVLQDLEHSHTARLHALDLNKPASA